MAKLGRIGLVVAIVAPVAMATGGGGAANPWLERTQVIAEPWDLPLVGEPRPGQKMKLSPKSEAQSERARAPSAAPSPSPAASIFPPPRPPESKIEPTVTVRDRAPQSAPVQDVPQQNSTGRNRDVERQLKRELPRIQAPANGVPPVPEQFACGERLAKIARYTPLPNRTGSNGCGAPDLVRLESILMPDQSIVKVNPAPQIRCAMAEQFAEWIRDDVGPAAAELGSPLASITGNDAYECRSRNHLKGAKISEHGRGNALDLTTFRLRAGGLYNLTDPHLAKPFRDRVRASACNRFRTVLGPGSDAHHNEHIHLDLAERSRNMRICQWEVREVQVATRPEPPAPANSRPTDAAAPAAPARSQPNPASAAAGMDSPPLPLRRPEALRARAEAQLEVREQSRQAGNRHKVRHYKRSFLYRSYLRHERHGLH